MHHDPLIKALVELEMDYNNLRRQHHQPSCHGCDLCMTGTTKSDREYRNAPDLDLVGRVLRPGT